MTIEFPGEFGLLSTEQRRSFARGYSGIILGVRRSASSDLVLNGDELATYSKEKDHILRNSDKYFFAPPWNCW